MNRLSHLSEFQQLWNVVSLEYEKLEAVQKLLTSGGLGRKRSTKSTLYDIHGRVSSSQQS